MPGEDSLPDDRQIIEIGNKEMLSLIATQNFQPTPSSASNADELANQFSNYLAHPAPAPGGRNRTHPGRVVYVAGDDDSNFGFQLAAALAKRSHLMVDLLEVSPDSGAFDSVIPEIVTLTAAGIVYEHHVHLGSIADWLPDHIMQFDDTVAIVVTDADLHRSGMLRLEHSLMPWLHDDGLPTLFLVADDHLHLHS